MAETRLTKGPSVLEKLADQIHTAIDLLGDDARWIGHSSGSLVVWSKKRGMELTIKAPTKEFSM